MYIYIVVEVTFNRAEYGSQRSDQPESVNFVPIIRGLKYDNLDWDRMQNPFHISKIRL